MRYVGSFVVSLVLWLSFSFGDNLKLYNKGNLLIVDKSGNYYTSIQEAIDDAFPGDTILIMPGIYRENLRTVRDGKRDKPITILGSPETILLGNNKERGKVFFIKNSYIHIVNLKINGKFKTCNTKHCYHDKLIYIKGSPDKYLEGIKILRNDLKNALGECLRLKYVKNSEIGWNNISHCGLRDFQFNRGKKNGEGIYVGTAPEQDKGRPDYTANIHIHHNFIFTYGSECVDVKENSTNIIITDNVCSKNQQETVGGISIRGNKNKVQNNIILFNRGSGVRLGGDTKEFGIYNTVKNNLIFGNTFCGLKIMTRPQEQIEGNFLIKNKCKVYMKKE